MISGTALLCGLFTLIKLTRSAAPIDHHATAETRHLYQTLLAYTNNPNKIMFGQHRAAEEGCSGGHLPYRLGAVHNGHHSWRFTDAQRLSKSADELCDVKDVTGQYPSVIGFDLHHLDSDSLLTTGWLIKKANEKGLIATLSWHQQNPVSGTSVYVSDAKGANIQHSITRILENGDLNNIYSIPVLFSGLLSLVKHIEDTGADDTGLAETAVGETGPIDTLATAETKQLYQTLRKYTQNPDKIMFGQHRATADGCSGGRPPYKMGRINHEHQSWLFSNAQRISKSADELCDIKDVTGQYPAAVSFDLRDLDPEYLLTIGWLIRKANEKGLIATLSWHQPNPVSGTSFYVEDHTGASIQYIVKRMLTNGDLNEMYRQQLDTLADWLRNLTDSAGRQIPVVFRPYHEMNGAWFWWGTSYATSNTAADYKHLFQYIVRYLRDTKQIHNIVYAFSPSKPRSLAIFYRFYPGDSFVDMVGMDYYYVQPFTPTINDFLTCVRVLTEVATAHDKPAAITEVGIQDNGIEKHHNFWMDHVLSPLKSEQGTTKVAYMLTWANFCMNRYTIYVPYQGHSASSNFSEFHNDTVMVFGSVSNHSNWYLIRIMGLRASIGYDHIFQDGDSTGVTQQAENTRLLKPEGRRRRL